VPSNKTKLLALRLLITAVLIYTVLRVVDLDQFVRVVQGVKLWPLILALVLLLCRLPINGLRWGLILIKRGHNFSVWYLTRLILIATFFSLFLPTSSGGDIARGMSLYQRNVPSREVVSSILFDRMAGVVCLIGLSSVPALYFLAFRPSLWRISLTVLGIAVTAFLVIVALRHLPAPAEAPNKEAGAARRMWSALRGLTNDLAAYIADVSLLVKTVVLSVAFQLVGIVSVFLVGLSVGAEAEFAYYLMFMPLIWLLTMIPISINGIGLRETSFVFLFGQTGMASEQALAVSAVLTLFSVALGLIGGVALLIGRSGLPSSGAEAKAAQPRGSGLANH